MEVYKLVQNEETNTFHIIKTPLNQNNFPIERMSKLVFDHANVDLYKLRDFNFYIPTLNFNLLKWGDIQTIRIAAAILANEGYNVCGNCVRELYKNNYVDLD